MPTSPHQDMPAITIGKIEFLGQAICSCFLYVLEYLFFFSILLNVNYTLIRKKGIKIHSYFHMKLGSFFLFLMLTLDYSSYTGKICVIAVLEGVYYMSIFYYKE